MAAFRSLMGLIEPGDSETTAVRKKAVLCLSILGLTGAIVSFMSTEAPVRYLYIAPFAVGAVFMAILFVRRRVSAAILGWNLFAYALTIVAIDWANTSHIEQRVWPYMVLLLDVNLVAEGPKCLPPVLLGVSLVWLVAASSETAFSFGLFKAAAALGSGKVRICDCEDPPCAKGGIGFVLSDALPSCSVMCLGYYFTSRFARYMKDANRSMEESIAIAQRIADALAALDLEAASSHLDTSKDLPPALKDAFSQILTNLTNYKPYIPEAVFNRVRPESYGTVAPGLHNNLAAIVFTDVKSSTATWDAEPGAMKQALRIHNKTLRKVMSSFNGYEVKTIGDAFMIAFENLQAAVGFGLAAQVALYEQTWPPELSALPQCATVAGAWHGLRIRVGVHYGEVEVEFNSVNERFDYFGTTVNKAARLEGVCSPGGVALDHSASTSVLPLFDGELVVVNKGLLYLRGLGETRVQVFHPRSLSLRETAVVVSMSRKVSIAPALSSRNSSTKLPAWNEDKNFASSTTGVSYLRDCQEGDRVREAAMQTHDTLERIQHCLDRSDGSLITVTGFSAIFGWNVVRACASHAENACRFATLLRQEKDAPVVGLCCNQHTVVSIPVGSQKFVTVVGYGVRIADRVCRRAFKMQCPALYAFPVTGTAMPSSLVAMLVQRETWDEHTSQGSALSFVVYTLQRDLGGDISSPRSMLALS
ncbi:Adenylate cyclase [Diplonema papillatum]|nr:Adenylate cyclase [Diplonema papillatum]